MLSPDSAQLTYCHIREKRPVPHHHAPMIEFNVDTVVRFINVLGDH